MKQTDPKGEIIIFKSEDGQTKIDVRLQEETVWLNQYQIAELFCTDRTVILKHIKNIYSTHELEMDSTCAKHAQVRIEGKRTIKREIQFYNLDVILSVGYRVNSKRGTQFRIWSNSVLKDYLVKGYALREKRLKEKLENLHDLEKAVQLIQGSLDDQDLKLVEAKGLLTVITEYAKSFILLNRFDSDTLEKEPVTEHVTHEISYEEALVAVRELKHALMERKEASELFGSTRDEALKGILGNIVQTFGGNYLYPSIEEQAAHLLYFIIKDHPFADGNKRIGSLLFIWFLERNAYLVNAKGMVKINENALVALALLVAQSKPSQKEIMITLIINLIRN